MNTVSELHTTSAGSKKIIRRFTLSYLGLYLALYLPYIERKGLDNLRWPIFCVIVCGFALVHFPKKFVKPRSLRLFFNLLFFNVGLRIVSTMWSPQQVYTVTRSISFGLLIIFIYTVSALVAKGSLTPDHVVRAIAVLGGVIFIPSTILWLGGFSRIPGTGLLLYKGSSSRFSGLVGNPNGMAILNSVLLAVILGYWLQDKKRRWPALIVVLCGLLMVVACQSRGGVIGVLLGMITMLVVLIGRARVSLALLAVGLVIGLYIDEESAMSKRFMDFVSRGKGASIQSIALNRTSRWEMGMASIRKHPILGQGYGVGGVTTTTDPEFTEYDTGYSLHNSFLQIWQENGLVGLVLIFAVVALIISSIARMGRTLSRDRYIFAGLAGLVVGGLAHACFESWLLSVGNLATMTFWLGTAIFMTISTGAYRQPAPEHQVTGSTDKVEARALRPRVSAGAAGK